MLNLRIAGSGTATFIGAAQRAEPRITMPSSAADLAWRLLAEMGAIAAQCAELLTRTPNNNRPPFALPAAARADELDALDTPGQVPTPVRAVLSVAGQRHPPGIGAASALALEKVAISEGPTSGAGAGSSSTSLHLKRGVAGSALHSDPMRGDEAGPRAVQILSVRVTAPLKRAPTALARLQGMFGFSLLPLLPVRKPRATSRAEATGPRRRIGHQLGATHSFADDRGPGCAPNRVRTGSRAIPAAASNAIGWDGLDEIAAPRPLALSRGARRRRGPEALMRAIARACSFRAATAVLADPRRRVSLRHDLILAEFVTFISGRMYRSTRLRAP
jgi:hypothetical protein